MLHGYLNVIGMGEVTLEGKERWRLQKTVLQTARGGGEGTRRVGCGGNRGIYGTVGVLGEMAYRLCVVESSGGE